MENTTTISNQVLNVGNYVKTSKGNIGVLVSVPRIEVGWVTDALQWFCLKSFSFNEENEAIEYINSPIRKNAVEIRKNHFYKINFIDKEELYTDVSSLEKLDNITIKIVKNEFSKFGIKLPIEDAKLLMEIYSRNNIWYCIV